MPHTRIKICGIRDAEAAHAAALAGADAIGLVFDERSPRNVTTSQAKKIVAALGPFVEPVAVFRGAAVKDILQLSAALGLRTLQLHGGYAPDVVATLAKYRVIRAISEARHLVPILAAKAKPIAIIWDSHEAGSGEQADWNQVARAKESGEISAEMPLILAGGLTPKNVAAAIRQIHPWAVDVSSGVESSRGVKDARKIQAFCQAVRDADAAS